MADLEADQTLLRADMAGAKHAEAEHQRPAEGIEESGDE